MKKERRNNRELIKIKKINARLLLAFGKSLAKMPEVKLFLTSRRQSMKILSLFLVLAVICVSTPFALANARASYEVSMLVSKGDDTKEENSRLTFSENSLKVVSKKNAAISKELNYADVKSADYSFSKKPMWKTGVATALILGVFALPFFFMKSKAHWLTVRTEKDFAVLKLEGDNYRQVLAEMETHGVKIETIKEEDSKDKKDKN